MYDSRSDHPRGPETRYGKNKHGASHPKRNARRYYGYYGRAVTLQPTMTARQEVADDAYNGTKGYDDLLPGLKRLGALEYQRRITLLADWERELLGLHLWPQPEEPSEAERAMHAYGIETEEDADALLASWEAEALGLPKETRWTTETNERYSLGYGGFSDRLLDEAEAEAQERGEADDVEHESDFLPLMSYREACDLMGEGFFIEGPSVEPDEPRKGAHYIHVWQLAREVGIESKHMVEWLRLTGEYVSSHASMVAMPVAARVRQEANQLQARYGQRRAATTSSEALTRLRTMLLADQPARTPRPGAPRDQRPMPERPMPANPFATV